MKADLRLVKPSISLEGEYLDMVSEWNDSGEELIPWSIGLDPTEFTNMVENLLGYSKGTALPDGFVPSSHYWLMDGNSKILGAIDIRHELSDFLAFRGGHIGYGIRPSERKKGYASCMLSLALRECRDIGLQKVLITCLKSNVASAKVIVNNGGVLESEDTDDGKTFQRYWIDLY